MLPPCNNPSTELDVLSFRTNWDPTAHSLSPAIHLAALAHFGLKGSYELIDTPAHQLAQTLAYVRDEKFTGLNVTIPHKQDFLRLSNQLTSQAKLAQAVNCVKIDHQSQLTGHNTDLQGFKNTLAANFAGYKSAFVAGTGGAARAAIWGLIELGYEQIVVVARDMAKAEGLVCQIRQALEESGGGKVYLQAQNCEQIKFDFQPQLIVNATSIGLDKHQLPPDWISSLFEKMEGKGSFLDMVYAAPGKTTALVELAQTHSLNARDGLRMLVEQAKLSFEFWTQLDCPIEVMLKAVGSTIKKQVD